MSNGKPKYLRPWQVWLYKVPNQHNWDPEQAKLRPIIILETYVTDDELKSGEISTTEIYPDYVIGTTKIDKYKNEDNALLIDKNLSSFFLNKPTIFRFNKLEKGDATYLTYNKIIKRGIYLGTLDKKEQEFIKSSMKNLKFYLPNVRDKELDESLKTIDKDIMSLIIDKFGTSDEPSNEAMYILQNGRFLYTTSTNDDALENDDTYYAVDDHENVNDFLIKNNLINYNEYKNKLYLVTLGSIRFNLTPDISYIQLNKDVKPTAQQYDSLLKVFDYCYYHNYKYISIVIGSIDDNDLVNQYLIKLPLYTSDDLIKKIKRFYSSNVFTEEFSSNQRIEKIDDIELYTAGYVLKSGDIFVLDEYHGEDSKYKNKLLPEFSSTHFEEDTCVRIYEEPNSNQYNSLEKIIDFYLDEAGYCKVEIQKSYASTFSFYKIFELYDDACKYPDDNAKVVGNWTGYKIIQIIKNTFSGGLLEATNNKGQELTPAQEKFFSKSKARDSKGNLLVCYHGTTKPGFNEFNPSKGNSQFGNYKFKNYNVNYFTTSFDVAQGYTDIGIGGLTDEDNDYKNIYACYLNIENPYIVDNSTKNEIKTWQGIQDKNIRKVELENFDRIMKKWDSLFPDIDDIDEINKDLYPFGYKLVKNEDNDEYVDVVKLETNTMYGAEHPVMTQYEVYQLFDKTEYANEFRDEVVGDLDNYPDDYYYDIDTIVKWVLFMNETKGTNYDGIIVDEILDVGPKGSFLGGYATDIVTLKSANQIKLVSNKNPTNSNNISEDIIEKC